MNYFQQRQLISHKKFDEQKTWLSCSSNNNNSNSPGENNQQVHGWIAAGAALGGRQGRLGLIMACWGRPWQGRPDMGIGTNDQQKNKKKSADLSCKVATDEQSLGLRVEQTHKRSVSQWHRIGQQPARPKYVLMRLLHFPGSGVSGRNKLTKSKENGCGRIASHYNKALWKLEDIIGPVCFVTSLVWVHEKNHVWCSDR